MLPETSTRISRHIVRFLLFTVVAAFSLQATYAAQDLKPAPYKFPNSYGNMTFPDSFPDGTSITITQWSHFVPRYDKWFDSYAKEWGKANNVDVTVNHINIADLASTLSSSIAAGKGATLFEMVAPPAAFIDGLRPLNDVNKAAQAAFGEQAGTCSHSSYLPAKDEWYGFCHGWVPDPGDYRVSLWKDAGYPDGPKSYEDLLKGGAKIYKDKGIPVGVGMSPEIDSEFYARALIWSFGGSIQDKNAQPTFDSDNVLEAVKYQEKLFSSAMTPEVFAWNAASNNQTYIAGQASYVQNSISFFRSAQDIGSDVAEDTGFRPGLNGPHGDKHMPAHVWFIYTVPKYVPEGPILQAAKKFMLDLENNYSSASYYAKLYNFPAFTSQVPQLFKDGGWLDHDPWGSKPADKLALLKTAEDWTAWLGYPGYANPAVAEIYQSHLISSLMANVSRGEKKPEEAVQETNEEIKSIFKKWRDKGYLSGGD